MVCAVPSARDDFLFCLHQRTQSFKTCLTNYLLSEFSVALSPPRSLFLPVASHRLSLGILPFLIVLFWGWGKGGVFLLIKNPANSGTTYYF